jgi:hypothetical protein
MSSKAIIPEAIAEVKIFVDKENYLWVISSDNLSMEETKDLIAQGLKAMDLKLNDPKATYLLRSVKHLFIVK